MACAAPACALGSIDLDQGWRRRVVRSKKMIAKQQAPRRWCGAAFLESCGMRASAIIAVVLASSGAAFAQSGQPVPMETRVFDMPRVGGYYVDRCLIWANQCNGEAAQKFCQLNGYQGATGWAWSYLKPTKLLGSGQICNLASPTGCGGITRVVCARVKSAAGQPPKPPQQQSLVARIHAQIEQVQKCQYRSGGNASRNSNYVCRVVFSLSNLGNTSVVFNYGKAVTPKPWGGGMSQSGIGYTTALNPGKKMLLAQDCIIPHGQSTGALYLEGAAVDPQGKSYTWKLTARCPSM
jgi:hypothetical protein